MHEWIIAMLVISSMLIIRDMAKTILAARTLSNGEVNALYEDHPQKERVEKYAKSFQKLAETYYGMPYRKDYLSNAQVEKIFQKVHKQMCENCHQRDVCWKQNRNQTYQSAYQLIRSIESGQEEQIRRSKGQWLGQCTRSQQFYQETSREFFQEKQNLIWNNKMIENRLAVAEQLTEISNMMQMVADDLYDIIQPDEEFADEMRKKLKKHGILMKNVWILDKEEEKKQLYLTIRTRSGQCISLSEVAAVVSEVCDCAMTASSESRCTLNSEYHAVHFVESVKYQVLHGVAKVTREKERVSGDNFSCSFEEEGQFLMCLSDGMGSGIEACKESEAVVELIEQFIDSGFSRETAARLVNSSLLLQGNDRMFSTMDICTVDLYTGICNFLKAGASTTFIKRDHWVEAISSTSLAVGLVQQIDYETTSRKLYSGDFLIMVTDGVLDALPLGQEEKTMKEIIMQVHSLSPKELGRGILDRVLGYCDYKARDDMTVLVAGLWKNRR